MTTHEIIQLKRFCQEIINTPKAIEEQPSIREGSFLWCADWEMIEIMKYLFLGETVYFVELPPRRLRNNPLWSKEAIKTKVEELLKVYETTEKIIEALRHERNGTASRIA